MPAWSYDSAASTNTAKVKRHIDPTRMAKQSGVHLYVSIGGYF